MTITASNAQPRLDLLGPILQDGFNRRTWIADRILPTYLINKLAGVIPSWMFTTAQILNLSHAKGMSYARVQSTVGTVSFACLENGVEEAVTINDEDIVTRDVLETQISRRLLNIILRNRELGVAQTLTGSTNGYTGTTTFANQLTPATAVWGPGATTANPYGDFAEAKLAIRQRIGLDATDAVMSGTVYTNLIQTPQIQSQIRNVLGYSGARVDDAIQLDIDPNLLAKVFGLERLHVGWGTYNTSHEGQTPAYSDCWDDTSMLVFRGCDSNDAQLNQDVVLGRMFVYDVANQLNELATGSIDTLKGLIMEMYNSPQANADILRCREFISQSVLVPTAGQLVTGVS